MILSGCLSLRFTGSGRNCRALAPVLVTGTCLACSFACEVPCDVDRQQGDQVRLTVLEQIHACSNVPVKLRPGTSLTLTQQAFDKETCDLWWAPIPPEPYADILQDCGGSPNVRCESKLDENCYGEWTMWGNVKVSRDDPVSDEAWINVRWTNPPCHPVDCPDTGYEGFRMHAEWLPVGGR